MPSMPTFTESVAARLFARARQKRARVPGVDFGKLRLLIFPQPALFPSYGASRLQFITFDFAHIIWTSCPLSDMLLCPVQESKKGNGSQPGYSGL